MTWMLDQNLPNPFSRAASMAFELSRRTRITLKVCNIQGQQVAVLADGFQDAVKHVMSFNGADLASGIYLCRLSAGGLVQTRKMVIRKQETQARFPAGSGEPDVVLPSDPVGVGIYFVRYRRQDLTVTIKTMFVR